MGGYNRHERGSLNRKLMSLAVASCFVAGAALANPTGPTVVNGQVSLQQAGNLLSITNTPNAIINWQSFSIGAHEITRFNQQSALSAVLNRVTGAGGVIDPSVILGALQSNGRVFLLNPAGIVFGAGAQVDVAGLVASSLNLSNADFLAGRLNFTEVPGAGAVVNGGAIHAGAGGQVYLVGPAVSNQGVITAPGGEVVLAAGQSVELVNPGTPNLRVEVVAPENEARNLGEIAAEAGRIGIYAGLIDHSGTSRADSAVATADGRIVLKATRDATVGAGSVVSASGARGGAVTIESGGTTLVAGTVAATGSAGAGGTVQVLGERVGLIDQARVDASGATGGGTVLVGGSFQGKDPAVRNAQVTHFGPQASIDVSATGAGDGGLAVVWSEETTRAYGTIAARGGAQSGHGGLVEVSSRGWLDFHAKTDRRAPHGKAGTLLLDPNDVEVTSFSSGGFFSGGGSGGDPSIWESGSGSTSQLAWSDINTELGNGDVIVTTSGPGTQNGDITILDPHTYSSNNLLQFVAHRNITVNSGATITNNAEGDVRLFAGWNGADPLSPTVQQGVGNIGINANVTTKGNINFAAGNNIAINGATVQVANSSTSANRSLTFTAGNQISIASAVRVDLSGGESNHSATINLNAGAGGISLNNSSVHARAQDGDFSGPGGAATINVNTSGSVSATNNSWFQAQGGYSDVDNGGAAMINVNASGNVSAANSWLQAVGGSSDAANGGPAAINFNAGGSVQFDNSWANAFGGSSNDGMGGSALIQLVANGNVSLVNGSELYTSTYYGGPVGSGNSNVTVSSGGNLNVQSSHIGAEGGTGGQARVQLAANGSVMIGDFSLIEAYSYAYNSNGNGTAAEVSIIGNSVVIDQLSMLSARGGSGAQSGGGAQVNVKAAGGELRIDGAEGSAYGGYGSMVRGGDAAMTLLGNAGVAIINSLGMYATGGEGDIAGGNASLSVAGSAISQAMSHVEASGGQGGDLSGSGVVSMIASAGDILITGASPAINPPPEAAFPNQIPIENETVVARGGFGANIGSTAGGAEVFLAATGQIRVTNEGVLAVGGAGEARGGDAKLTMAAPGGIVITDSHVVAEGGFSDLVGGRADLQMASAGNIEVKGTPGLAATVIARGGRVFFEEGTPGGAQVLMALTGPTSSVIVDNDSVRAYGGPVGFEEDPGQIPSFGPDALISLDFHGRSTGGFAVNGVESAITGTGSDGSPLFGFFVNGVPAVPGTNFLVRYFGSQAVPSNIESAPLVALQDLLDKLEDPNAQSEAAGESDEGTGQKKKKQQQTCS